jgi:hypothetical protein
VKSDRVHRALLLLCAVSAAACIAELLWLRSAQLTVTRPLIAVLFLPWFAAAAANLGVWYSTLARGERTPLNRLSAVLLRIVSAAFAIAFLALYGWLLFGTSSG